MTLDVALMHRFSSFELDVAFTAERGVTALFGRSGAGKTSVINAVAGLLRPDRGRIDVSGTRLLDTAIGVDVPSHRRRIGYVFQDARLFPHLTVRQNLLFGRWFSEAGNASSEFAHIVALLGIAALLDHRPGTLSGGEKQRVAIARAILHNPQILILDEATSALDSEVESAIQEQLINLMAGKTVIAIAHRLSTIAAMDRLIIMDEGRIVEEGTHGELLKRGGLYADLWARQSGGFLASEAAE